MVEALTIAVGIWLGGLALVGTFWIGTVVADNINRNRRYGARWYEGLLRARH